MEKNYRIDQELNSILPELSMEDYRELEQSLLIDGYKGAPIMIWGDIIVDGHNRYEICKRNNIPYEVKTVEFESKDDAIQWMVRQQLGRRNLSPLQRIKLVETYRPIYEKRARENQLSGLKQNKNTVSKNSAERNEPKMKIDVRAQCAKDAGISTDTYSKGVKILNSGNSELIKSVENGEKSINKGCNELKAHCEQTKSISDESTKNELHGDTLEFKDKEKTLLQIQSHYKEFLTVFENDITWLTERDFIKRDEDITSKIHSDLRNCFEKFRSIKELMENMKMDELDNNTVEVGK